MTKYLLAVVALMGMGAVGCGKDDCEDAADRLTAKMEECGMKTEGSASASGSGAECTEEAGKAAQKLAGCYESADCKAIKGEDADAALKLGECITK